MHRQQLKIKKSCKTFNQDPRVAMFFSIHILVFSCVLSHKLLIQVVKVSRGLKKKKNSVVILRFVSDCQRLNQ